MSKLTKRKLTANEVMGLSEGLGFLSTRELKEIPVPIMWDVVDSITTIKGPEENIRELGKKINEGFYEDVDTENGSERRLKKGVSEDFEKANKELGEKTFELDLPTIEFTKIEKTKQLTGRHLIGLKPILKR